MICDCEYCLLKGRHPSECLDKVLGNVCACLLQQAVPQPLVEQQACHNGWAAELTVICTPSVQLHVYELGAAQLVAAKHWFECWCMRSAHPVAGSSAEQTMRL